MKYRIGDTVMVRKGSDKGKTGKITAIHNKTDMVTIDGVNIVTKHNKPTAAKREGGISKEARPLSIAKIGLVHPTKKNATSRIGYEVKKTGKTRVYRQASNKEIK